MNAPPPTGAELAALAILSERNVDLMERARVMFHKLLPDEKARAIYQALGSASMCWHPTPTGVFDFTAAAVIGEALIEKLDLQTPPADVEPLMAFKALFARAARSMSGSDADALQALSDAILSNDLAKWSTSPKGTR
jgi:hypothetical protein